MFFPGSVAAPNASGGLRKAKPAAMIRKPSFMLLLPFADDFNDKKMTIVLPANLFNAGWV
jgi:hypothetical protein